VFPHHWLCLSLAGPPMLRVTESKSPEAAKQYFGKGMVRSDYYIDGQEIAGNGVARPPSG
jgi:hypothetical protein